ncbi:MAG: Fic family protein [Akkermansiaceae bacterium]|nr:Fic family protein [Armatimonadota bacterium]
MKGADASSVLRSEHPDWYQALFAPSVRAGLLSPATLAGYRAGQVYIYGSRHVPLPAHAVGDAMETLFDLVASEENAAVRAVLGHFLFVYIHPYSDGNGRMARFLMNALFAGGGFPWIVIHLGSRDRYMGALESASVDGDIKPFAACVLEEMDANRKNNALGTLFGFLRNARLMPPGNTGCVRKTGAAPTNGGSRKREI